MKKILSLSLLFNLLISVNASNNRIHVFSSSNVGYFIENKGQWNDEVLFLTKIGGMNAWITKSGVIYDYYEIERDYINNILMDNQSIFEKPDATIYGHVIEMYFVNADNKLQKYGDVIADRYYNYFTGDEKSKWVSNATLYKEIEVREVYEGISVKYYFDKGLLRYDYKISPGADVTQIKIAFRGEDEIRINDRGELVIKTNLGEVIHGGLYAYQINNYNAEEISCSFIINDEGTVGINVEEYDKEKEIIIDPIIYATFLGGSGVDGANSIALDNDGNVYITGETYSSDFPVTIGAYQTNYKSNADAFLAKINPAGDSLKFSTFFGGSNFESSQSLTLDIQGNIYITGSTASDNFPTTMGAYDSGTNGTVDAFVVKFDPTGSALVYSTLLGNSGSEYGFSIAVDKENCAYVAGVAYGSDDFPTTVGAFQTSIKNLSDIFVTKFDSTGSSLIYSTLLGGNNNDEVNSLKLDNYGNVYITGRTRSDDFPVTAGVYQVNHNGGWDVFVTKINSMGDSLKYSTYLGGSGDEHGFSIELDSDGYAYIAGTTGSTNFPITTGAYKSVKSGTTDAFITRLNPLGSDLIYSTMLGGSGYDAARSIKIDSERNAYVAGETSTPGNFPTTDGSNRYDESGYYEVFATKLNTTGNNLVYSTLFGGNNHDWGYSLALDKNENIFVAGVTASADFPITEGSFQTIHGGGSNYYYDAFVIKLNLTNVSSIVENKSIPEKFMLTQNYPNPFNPVTIIKYNIPNVDREGFPIYNVQLKVYDVIGREITTLVNEVQSPGNYEVIFNASNLPSGVYIYSIKAGSFNEVRKMMLIK